MKNIKFNLNGLLMRWSEGDQVESEKDQVGSERDQVESERDQVKVSKSQSLIEKIKVNCVKCVNCVMQIFKGLTGYGLPVMGGSCTDESTRKVRVLSRITPMFLLLTLGVGEVWADDADVADIGGVFSVNGSTEKYKIATKSDYLTCTACTDWSIKSWTSYSGHNFGNVSSFKLKGVAVSGWATKGKSDWFAAKIFYKIYASGSSEPGSNTGDFGVGNYDSPGSGNTSGLYKCDNCYESDNSIKKVIGMDNQDVDLIGDRAPGVYNMKIFTNTQSLWNNGSGGYNTYLQS